MDMEVEDKARYTLHGRQPSDAGAFISESRVVSAFSVSTADKQLLHTGQHRR